MKVNSKLKKNLLDTLRSQINEVDQKIISYLAKRSTIVKKIGETKKVQGIKTVDLAREQIVLNNILQSPNKKDLKNDYLTVIFREIISYSRSLQQIPKVAYLGPEGTYTHQATEAFFGKEIELLPVRTGEEVFKEIESERADFGVIPIENSTEGPVRQTHTRLIQTTLTIVGEVYLPIHHYLLAHSKKEKLKKIYSHPQAIGQTRKWTGENFPDVPLVETTSTAEAVRIAKHTPGSAAIGSLFAAKVYDMTVLASNIEDDPDNTTRFFILQKDGENLEKMRKMEEKGIFKTSIIFATKDRPGVLRDCLSVFADRKINLSRIISHPEKLRLWDFVFFIDAEAHLSQSSLQEALKDLTNYTQMVKVLGCYKVWK